MAYEYLNLNPSQKIVGDCVVRAIALATGDSWDKTYIGLSLLGFLNKDVFTSNSIWGAYLMQNGFERHVIPSTCPECFTIADFVEEHPIGLYILATGTHVVTAIDGKFYDTWPSGDQVPQYYWTK